MLLEPELKLDSWKNTSLEQPVSQHDSTTKQHQKSKLSSKTVSSKPTSDTIKKLAEDCNNCSYKGLFTIYVDRILQIF